MRRLAQSAHKVSRFDWSQLTPAQAARLTPALVLVLALGLAFGEPRLGAVAASGAYTVGFGAFQQFTKSSAAPMLFAWLGTGIATIVGTLAGNAHVAIVPAVMICGFLCGLAPAIGMGAFWIAQQFGIYLVVASAYAGGIEQALDRAALVMAGGLVQLVCYAAILVAERLAVPRVNIARDLADGFIAFSGLKLHCRLRSPWFLFGVRVAIGMGIAEAAERWLGLANGYWIAVTALILMRPDFHDAMERSVGRIVGTIMGAVVATMISQYFLPPPAALAVLVIVFGGLSLATLRLNYGAFALCNTAYVVFEFVLAGIAEKEVAAARIVATAIGAAFAILVHIDVALRLRRAREDKDQAT